MPEQFEQDFSGEREPSEFTTHIKRMEDWAGEPLESLAERAVEKISQRTERSKEKFRAQHDIAPDEDFEEAVRTLVAEAVAEYGAGFDEFSNRIQMAADRSIALARENDYLALTPRDITVVPMNKLLSFGRPDELYYTHLNSYDPNGDIISVDTESTESLVSHEVAHALSSDVEKMRSGVLELVRDPEISRIHSRGAQWINEGITVIWERMCADDSDQNEDRREPDSLYGWAADAVPLLMERLGLDTETALRAYFGDEQSMNRLTEAVRNNFHCSLDDMQALGFRLDLAWTKKVLAGEQVIVTVHASNREHMQETIDVLTRVFPNVSVEIK